ncbi:MAG: hypothetical protein ABSG80_11590 [Verrucomicrobiota bacterium]
MRYTDPTGLDFIASTADLLYGYIPGPNAYKTGNSTIGKIGASVYNVAPLIANATFQGMRGLAAADRAVGDVLATGTFAVTRDPQLAENSRNLTLLVGGIGELGKTAKVGEAMATVEEAQQLYKIDNGVRRSVAANLLGQDTVPAAIKQAGQADKITDVPISSLRSPKTELSTDSRFINNNLKPAQNGSKPPPIEVTPINGELPGHVPVKDVKLVPPEN